MISSFHGERLMPGDTIVVPEDFDRTTWTKTLKDCLMCRVRRSSLLRTTGPSAADLRETSLAFALSRMA